VGRGADVAVQASAQGRVELVAQMFNVLGSGRTSAIPAATSLLFNFDGTLRSGPRGSAAARK